MPYPIYYYGGYGWDYGYGGSCGGGGCSGVGGCSGGIDIGGGGCDGGIFFFIYLYNDFKINFVTNYRWSWW